jgi:hypothetical protein
MNWALYLFWASALLVQAFSYRSAAITLFQILLGIVLWLSKIALTFVLFNAAAVLAFVNFVCGRETLWVRS